MFSWLVSLFKRKPTLKEMSLYTEEERLIYSYWNGEKIVKADPMVLYKKLVTIGPDLEADMLGARSKSKKAMEYHDGVIKKLRNLFGVKSFEEGGLTEQETLSLYDHFQDYVGVIKKNGNPSATSQEETSPDTSASTPPSTEGSSTPSPPTPSSSDSGSTEKESSTNSPKQSTSVPETPLV